MVPNTHHQNTPHHIDSTTSESTIKDLITDVLTDLQRIQIVTKSPLINMSNLTKYSSSKGMVSSRGNNPGCSTMSPTYPSHRELMAEGELIDDRILIHNSQLTQRMHSMAGQIRRLKQAQPEAVGCNSECQGKVRRLWEALGGFKGFGGNDK